MITKEKLKIYKKYRGNSDSWFRSSRNSEKVILDSDWQIIDDLYTDIHMIKRDLASAEYVANANEKIRKACDSEETIDLLRKNVEKQMNKK